jgi:hypothetical protein
MPLPNGYGFDSANLNVFAHGDRHVQARYLGPSGVSLHPLQRLGVVASTSHNHPVNARAGAQGLPQLGDGPPAGLAHNASLPPLVNAIGSPRDFRVMI